MTLLPPSELPNSHQLAGFIRSPIPRGAGSGGRGLSRSQRQHLAWGGGAAVRVVVDTAQALEDLRLQETLVQSSQVTLG